MATQGVRGRGQRRNEPWRTHSVGQGPALWRVLQSKPCGAPLPLTEVKSQPRKATQGLFQLRDIAEEENCWRLWRPGVAGGGVCSGSMGDS